MFLLRSFNEGLNCILKQIVIKIVVYAQKEMQIELFQGRQTVVYDPGESIGATLLFGQLDYYLIVPIHHQQSVLDYFHTFLKGNSLTRPHIHKSKDHIFAISQRHHHQLPPKVSVFKFEPVSKLFPLKQCFLHYVARIAFFLFDHC
jgi:hypothetical protein